MKYPECGFLRFLGSLNSNLTPEIWIFSIQDGLFNELSDRFNSNSAISETFRQTFMEIATIFCNFVDHTDTAISILKFWGEFRIHYLKNFRKLSFTQIERFFKILIRHYESKYFKFLESHSNSTNPKTLRYHIVLILQVLLSCQKSSNCVNNSLSKSAKLCQSLWNPVKLCRKLWLLFIFFLLQSFDIRKKTEKKGVNFKL